MDRKGTTDRGWPREDSLRAAALLEPAMRSRGDVLRRIERLREALANRQFNMAQRLAVAGAIDSLLWVAGQPYEGLAPKLVGDSIDELETFLKELTQ